MKRGNKKLSRVPKVYLKIAIAVDGRSITELAKELKCSREELSRMINGHNPAKRLTAELETLLGIQSDSK
ncbi:MAG TPA: hypothetical protein DIW47_11000 [Bacteroidetes bacterium]|nr:hypothetical protein [Bacteroidota bacterium]